jgi:hypothetical protein
MEETKIFPSKLFANFALFEWGLSSFKLLGPHSFMGVGKEDKEVTFFCHIENHKDFTVSIPSNNEDFVILCIPNKAGDNCVVMKSSDCSGRVMSLEEIAKVIKRKFRANPRP